MAHKNRDGIDEALAVALACGATVEQAAAKVGISVRTAHRRLEDPAFQAKVRTLRRQTVERTAAVLIAASAETVRTLLGLQKDTVAPPVRLGAAKAILEIGMKARELAELEEQLAELETRIQEIETERGNAR